jgi:intracellular sulfur oxidation DsrE/DsrF family protein
VRFTACKQTLKSQEISPDALISGVELVSSGAVEVISKQQQGYAFAPERSRKENVSPYKN